MIVVTGGHAVDDFVVGGGDIEVLRPQHRMAFGQNVFERISAGVVAAVDPLGGTRVQVKKCVGRQRVL